MMGPALVMKRKREGRAFFLLEVFEAGQERYQEAYVPPQRGLLLVVEVLASLFQVRFSYNRFFRKGTGYNRFCRLSPQNR